MALEGTLRGKAWQSVSWLVLREAAEEAAPVPGLCLWLLAASLPQGSGRVWQGCHDAAAERPNWRSA